MKVSLVAMLLPCLLLLMKSPLTWGHGRLIQPPSRSSAWRYKFPTPKNYNDHELYCGGFARQWMSNKGKCGPCGDAWDLPSPRPNEAGGKYGTGLIVDKWRKDQVVTIGVEITANHMGYFEFRICPHNDKKRPVTNACLDQHVLKRADGKGQRFHPGALGNGKMYAKYQLPKGMTCEQCVFQWRYVAGNNWGRCEDGTEGIGCGPQEQFRACADVSILELDGSADNTPSKYPDYVDYDDINETEEDNEIYNEIDIDTRTTYNTPYVESNHAGHVVALTLSFLLIIIVIFGLIVYFYWVQDALKDFVRKQKLRWINSEPPTITIPSGKLSQINSLSFPVSRAVTPPIPPRRHKSAPQVPPPPQRSIRTISPPTNVSINGIRVCPSHPSTEASLHTPDD